MSKETRQILFTDASCWILNRFDATGEATAASAAEFILLSQGFQSQLSTSREEPPVGHSSWCLGEGRDVASVLLTDVTEDVI